MAGLTRVQMDEKLHQEFELLLKIMTSKEEDHTLIRRMTEVVRENRQLARMTNMHRETALQVGLAHSCSHDKVMIVLQHREVAAQRMNTGRLPLHMAIQHNPRDDILSDILEAYPQAAHEPDNDGRLVLHCVLESVPFPEHFIHFALKLLKLYPEACAASWLGRMPLHMAVDGSLPPRLVLRLLKENRAAAGSMDSEGKLPLHSGLESNVDIRVIRELVEAYPGALLVKMPYQGGYVGVQEYAIRMRRSRPVIQCLMEGGSCNNPKVAAYARAATMGAFTKPVGHPATAAEGERVHADEATAARSRVSFVVQPSPGHPLLMELDFHSQVGELKMLIYKREGTPPNRQRLELNGRQLLNGQTLLESKIFKDSVVHLSERVELLQHGLRNAMDEELALRLLELRPEVAREADNHGVYPLHVAILNYAGKGIIKRLLQENPSAVKTEVHGGQLGEYPLHAALARGYSTDVIEALLEHATASDWQPLDRGLYNPNHAQVHPDDQYPMPLHLAIENKCSNDTIKLLLEKRCPIHARNRKTGRSALDSVLVSGMADEMFELILSRMMEASQSSILDRSPVTGQTLLHVAASSGVATDVLERIFECEKHIIEALAQNKSGARDQAQKESGAGDKMMIGKRDLDRRLPIHVAAANHAPVFIVNSLLEKYPDSIFEPDNQGRTPIQLAVANRAKPGVVFAISRLDGTPDKRSLHGRGNDGLTLLELAINSNAPVWIIRELLEACPSLAASVDLLNGRWPNTKAASEVLRIANEAARQRPSANHQRRRSVEEELTISDQEMQANRERVSRAAEAAHSLEALTAGFSAVSRSTSAANSARNGGSPAGGARNSTRRSQPTIDLGWAAAAAQGQGQAASGTTASSHSSNAAAEEPQEAWPAH